MCRQWKPFRYIVNNKYLLADKKYMSVRTYSPYNRKAVSLLGKMISAYRKERKVTTQDLADRAGISRTTLQKIEKGGMKSEIGIVFEVAALVGIELFDRDATSLDSIEEKFDNKIALLPKSIRTSTKDVDDAF